jgi:predicted DNA-binding transcriptional regulator AlpA
MLTPPIPVIEPNAVLTEEALREVFGVTAEMLAKETRAGRLRVSRRGGRLYILGEWFLDWIRAGEVKEEPDGEDTAPEEKPPEEKPRPRLRGRHIKNPPPMPPDEPVAPGPAGTGLLRKSQVAEMMGVSPRCLDRWVSTGEFPAPIRFNNQVVRWDRATIEAWFEEKKEKRKP